MSESRSPEELEAELEAAMAAEKARVDVPAQAAEEPDFTPKTREGIEAQVQAMQWRVEIDVVLQNLRQAQLDLAVAKVSERLVPSGGMAHLTKIRDSGRQAAQRIRILEEAWLELQSQEPLEAPSELAIVSGLVVPVE